MSTMTGFNSPLLLGFDHLERMLDQASRASAEGYPPYNIEQMGESGLRITLAVAGFSMDDLDIENITSNSDVNKLYTPIKSKETKFIEGSNDEIATELMEILKNEIKIIN